MLGWLVGQLFAIHPQQTGDRVEADFQDRVRPFLTSYCTGCHNATMKMAGLDLGAYANSGDVLENRQVWSGVLEKLESGQMPPAGQPRPGEAEVTPILTWIRSQIGVSNQSLPVDPGRVTVRRLNRSEYNNTIRDLLDIDLRPADDFPVDDSGYGFDNIGDVLSLSPVLMEKYLAGAGRVAEAAIITPPNIQPTIVHYLAPRAPLSETDAPDLPAIPFSMGGVLRTQHRVGLDAEYLLQLYVVDRRDAPEAKEGEEPPPPDVAQLVLEVDEEPVATFDIEAGGYKPSEYESRLQLEAGGHQVEAYFVRDWSRKKPCPPEETDCETFRDLYVDYLEIHGPFNSRTGPLTNSHRRVFICGHSIGDHQPACTGSILRRLARRAYRRPVAESEVEALNRVVQLALAEGESFEQGIQLALQAVLVSPHFLFRVEKDPDPNNAADVHEVGPFELASRLSYFLWSSMPDEELFQAAESLQQHPEELERQVRRMLQDSKSRSLVQDFAGQWLQLRNLQGAAPDPDRFPAFDDELRIAMRQETELFLQAMIREDRNIVDFIDAPFTFLNERLASHYGIDGVRGDDFRRVRLSGEQRSGVLTHASILTVSSHPTRTSPVLRGKWLLDNVLGAPPPPPPTVEKLKEEEIGSLGSLREQLEKHRANPSCAVCHLRMDTLGFGLENYDAVGSWRRYDGNFPVDSSGTLPDGRSFRTPAELKAILRSDRDDFSRCLTEKMLTYALGRGLESYDRSAVDAICAQLAENDYRFSTLVLEIVKSQPFRMRRGDGGKP